MRKRYKALEQTFEEHLATHEALIDTHEKLKEAHSSLHAQKKELIEIASVGVTCDILDESFYAPIVVAPTTTQILSAAGVLGFARRTKPSAALQRPR